MVDPEIPTQLMVGFGLAIAGSVLVLGSLAAERVVDLRAEERFEP